jgi:hypothetical protein
MNEALARLARYEPFAGIAAELQRRRSSPNVATYKYFTRGNGIPCPLGEWTGDEKNNWISIYCVKKSNVRLPASDETAISNKDGVSVFVRMGAFGLPVGSGPETTVYLSIYYKGIAVTVPCLEGTHNYARWDDPMPFPEKVLGTASLEDLKAFAVMLVACTQDELASDVEKFHAVQDTIAAAVRALTTYDGVPDDIITQRLRALAPEVL